VYPELLIWVDGLFHREGGKTQKKTGPGLPESILDQQKFLGGISDFTFQISHFRFHISDFTFHIPTFCINQLVRSFNAINSKMKIKIGAGILKSEM